MIPSEADLVASHQRIGAHVHRTPVLTSRSLNDLVDCELFFKCENFQRAGSFKIRGASNAILSLTPDQCDQGVVAHSSGNFAQAIALAARSVGVRACIVMPSTAPAVKVAATKAYGGEIITCLPTAAERELQAHRIVQERGATFVHPSNDRQVIVGQSTAAIELLQDHSDLDVLVVPVGGGGLIAGCALAAQYWGTNCTVVGAEPLAADDAYRSMASGKIESNETTLTIADGLRTFLGDQNFPIIQQHVDRIIRVAEDEIVAAMMLIWQRMKIVVEPSAAVTMAAIERESHQFAGMKVGLILSGGNVDLRALPF